MVFDPPIGNSNLKKILKQTVLNLAIGREIYKQKLAIITLRKSTHQKSEINMVRASFTLFLVHHLTAISVPIL